jgi:predicted dehydrogenase
MNCTSFAIIGGGFRTQSFLRVASELSELFDVCGMVVRDQGKGHVIEQKWGVKTFRTLDQLLDAASPDFIVISVTAPASEHYIVQLASHGIPVLVETPPSRDLEGLIQLYRTIPPHAKVQVAEQYQFHPMHAARITLVQSGALGCISQASVSVSHGYHGMSLMRKFLGVGFENASIRAMSFESPIVAGPTRGGPPTYESVVMNRRDIAWFEFEHSLGIYDFAKDQHRSWIRSTYVSIRGERGEIQNHSVNRLADYAVPQHLTFHRINRGEEENVEGYFLNGIMLGDKWIYQNPFPCARLYDDEIAVATCLVKMAAYIRGGDSFYDLREAAQDQYLALLMEEAIQSGSTVISHSQPWA